MFRPSFIFLPSPLPELELVEDGRLSGGVQTDLSLALVVESEREKKLVEFPSLCLFARLPPSTMPPTTGEKRRKTAAMEKKLQPSLAPPFTARCFPPFGGRSRLDALCARARVKGPRKAEKERARLRFRSLLCSEDTRCPPRSSFSQRPSSPTPNTSDALERPTQDALARGHLSAVLSSFQARVSPDTELLHVYAALEGPGGDGRGKHTGADAFCSCFLLRARWGCFPPSIVFLLFRHREEKNASSTRLPSGCASRASRRGGRTAS